MSPKALAVEALEPMIARLPSFRRQQSDKLVISQRLIELLPSGKQGATRGPEQAGAKGKKYFDTVIVLACFPLGRQRSTLCCDLTPTRRSVHFARKTMKYLVPPIVIPILLLIGVAAYGLFGPPIVAGHHPASSLNSQSR